MTATKQQKLENLIRSKTIPKTLLYISLITMLLVSGLLYFSYSQTESRHQNYINRFTTHLENRLSNIQTEIYNLAQNDLIINSLVDFEFQEQALPIFIRSLKLSVNPVAIGFTDFKGNLVTSNNIFMDSKISQFSDWREDVLKKGKRFLKFNHGSLLIAEPIIYAEKPEAALIIYIEHISSLIGALSPGTNNFILSDTQGNVLFSTDTATYPLNSNINTINFDGVYTLDKPFLDWKIISTEPYWDSYQDLLPLVIFLLIGLVGVIAATFSGVRIASKQASSAIHDLKSTLAHTASFSFDDMSKHTTTDDRALTTQTSNIDEFIDIQIQFSKLLNDLNSTALSRNTLAGVVDSLDEVLLVLNFNNEVILQNRRLKRLLLDLDVVLPIDIFRVIPRDFLTSSSPDEFQECSYLPEDFPSLTLPMEFKWQRHFFKNEQGEHIGFTLSGNDITLEKAIEAELLLKNKAVDEANTSIIISEVSGDGFPIIYVNKAFEKLTGFQKETTIGRECKFLQGPNSEKEKLSQIHHALHHAEPLCVTLTNYRKDGSPFQNQLTLSPIFDSAGNMTHVIGLQEDVSEREKANALIREAQLKAEESAKLKSNFLASMSHEIRTPMNGILGMLNIIKETNLAPSQKQQLMLAEQSATSLLVIINDILDFSKIEAGKLHLEPIEFDLYKETHKLIQSMMGTALKKSIQLIIDLSGLESPYLIGDPVRIKQILTNLISNAIKFTEHGTITIAMHTKSLASKRLMLLVDVIDQGTGISSNSVDKIFDTFTQADSSTTRKHGGTGLGLSISRQLCRMMGGDISVKSELGVGSTFSFELVLTASSKDFRPPVEYQKRPVYILDSHLSTAKMIEQQLSSWQSKAMVCDSINALRSSLLENKPCIIFIDEETLNKLNKEDFASTKSAFELLSPSTLMISTQEFNPYINHALFGDKPKHSLRHLVKPITATQLIECISKDTQRSKIHSNIAKDTKNLFSGKHILLVEDNHINQIVATDILASLGAEITLANHGIEAINILQDQPAYFDLILMDCQMPEMDGYEASSLIRQQKAGECYGNIPIIALTANALKGDREKCLAAGMNDHVSKPIDIDELKKTLQLWLKIETQSDAETLAPLSQEPMPNEEEANSDDHPAEDKSSSTSTNDFDSISIWNEAEMLHRIANNMALGIKLVDVFCLDVDDIFTKIITSHKNQNMEQIAFNAHTLKGVASNISGLKLAHLCAKIEMDAKAGITDDIDTYIKRLYPIISELKDTLKKRSLEWQS